MDCFELNYPDSSSVDLCLDAIRIGIRNLRLSRGRYVPPASTRTAQTFGDRQQNNLKLKQRVMAARARLVRDHGHDANEDSGEEIDEDPEL
jgi:hypothetical protein